MKTIKILFFITMVIISVVLIAAAIAPDNVTITSEITINTKPEQVYNNVVSLKKWKFWSPFEHDSTMVDEFSGPESGVGCTRTWKGKRIGEGKMTIIKTEPFSSIKNKLDFGTKGGAIGTWNFKAIDTIQTKVTWSTHITGLKFPFEKLMGLFLDSMMKPMFNDGLQDLKEYTETGIVTQKKINKHPKIINITMNNTLAYIIFAIVMLHLVAGFAWAFIKMNKKPNNKNTNKQNKS